MKSFARYISEAAKKKTSPCYAKFEKIVFGELLGKKEDDTSVEKKISDKVEDWFNSGGASARQSVKLVDAFKQLIACKNEYPDEFSPGDRVIYRGIRVSGSQLKKWIEGQTNFAIKGNYATTKPFVYKAFDTLESWTSNLSIAKRFAIVYEDDFFDELDNSIRGLETEVMNLLRHIKKYERNPDSTHAQDDFIVSFDTVYAIMDGIQYDFKTEKSVQFGVIFVMKADKGCVLTPNFSNKISNAFALGSEHEVVRVDVGQSTKAELMFPAGLATRLDLIDEMKEILDFIPDLSTHSNKKISDTYNKTVNFKGKFARMKKFLQEVE